jgi:hypothetical protein
MTRGSGRSSRMPSMRGTRISDGCSPLGCSGRWGWGAGAFTEGGDDLASGFLAAASPLFLGTTSAAPAAGAAPRLAAAPACGRRAGARGPVPGGLVSSQSSAVGENGAVSIRRLPVFLRHLKNDWTLGSPASLRLARIFHKKELVSGLKTS